MAYGRRRKTTTRRKTSAGSARRSTRVRRATGVRKRGVSRGHSSRPITVRIVMQGVPAATAPASLGQKSLAPVRAMF